MPGSWENLAGLPRGLNTPEQWRQAAETAGTIVITAPTDARGTVNARNSLRHQLITTGLTVVTDVTAAQMAQAMRFVPAKTPPGFGSGVNAATCRRAEPLSQGELPRRGVRPAGDGTQRATPR